jgi:hypothetical protein
VAENKIQWCNIVNTVMNFRFHKIGEFVDQLADYQLLKTNDALKIKPRPTILKQLL